MIWLSWRQQRAETILVAAVLAALAAVLIPNGVHMASAYDAAHLSSCLTSRPHPCAEAVALFNARFDGLNGVFVWFNFVPGLIGVILAAPFVLDLEQGTYRLGWTQSVTRRRWLATKLGTAIACAVVATALATTLFTWWRGPLDAVNGRLDIAVFDFEGIVPYAYTLFGLTLALAIGAATRRIVPAMLGGLAGYAAVRIFVQDWLRRRFERPITMTWPTWVHGPELHRAWILDQHFTDRLGHALPGNGAALFNSCPPGLTRTGLVDCLARHGAYNHAVYHPAERFWAFQGIEFALFIALSLALLVFAVARTAGARA